MPQRSERVFVGREQVLQEISSAIVGSGNAGAVLVGEAGIGKTALIQQVLRRLDSDFHTVHIRGSAFSAKLPYGALSVLLSELGPELNQHPVFMIARLSELLKAQAEGLPIIFAVDNAEHLDAFSTTVLNQLVLDGTGRVMLAVRDFAEMPEDIIDLWREGSLHRFDIGPLTYHESRDYLTGELGRRISRTAVDELWRSSGGNPLYLRMGCYDLKEAQRLVLQDGVWVLWPGRGEPGRHTADALLGHVSSLAPGQVEVIDILSLAGSLTLPLLLRISNGADVDLLQENGVLTIGQGPASSVYLTNALLARTVAARISVGRRKALYEKLLAAVDPGAEPPIDSCRRADWITSYGGKLSSKAALAAARSANRRSQAALAFDLAASGEGPRTAALVVEAAAALTAMGDTKAATQELASYWAEASAPVTLLDWAHLKIAESRLLQDTAGSGARRLLEEVGNCLEDSAAGRQRQTYSKLRDELAMAQAELASFEGRFTDNASSLSSIFPAADEKDINFRLRIGALLCEAWAMTERQEDARELAEELMVLLADPRLTAQSKELAHEHVGIAYHMTGGWPEYHREGHSAAAPDDGISFRAGTAGELVDGLGRTYSAQTDLALELLLPALSQLHVSDPHGVLPLAAAATAYCHAKEGHLQQARLQLRYANDSKRGSWKVRRDAAHFAALTTALVESRGSAIEQLRVICESDRRQGIASYELIGLCCAVRLGDSSSIERMLTVAASTQGSFALLCETYAKGLGDQDPDMLVQAMTMATNAGDHLFATEVAETALQLASDAGDRSGVRHVRRHIRDAVARTPDRGLRDSNLDMLTSRELEIAGRACKGASNRELAEQMCVSVRTIEGHLYRVYAKLCIDNRAELSALLATEYAAS